MTEYSIKQLVYRSKKNLDKFSELLLKIINNDKLGLTQEIKNKNIDSLKNLCVQFKKILPTLKDDLKDLLEIKKLKNDNQALIRKIYEKKNNEYKTEVSYEKFCEKVEIIIYAKISSAKEDIIHDVLHTEFIHFIFKMIKLELLEQFKCCEEETINQIYF